MLLCSLGKSKEDKKNTSQAATLFSQKITVSARFFGVKNRVAVSLGSRRIAANN
jgi:hypothetical protein